MALVQVLILRDAWSDADVNNAAEEGSEPKGNFKQLTPEDDVWVTISRLTG